mmetsp:Transcript_2086/g.2863  ORF Transcript_2086/g.2863 Transcript_2086/m.2863 type:complete len:116 (+) Transcript_2086:138-485(+)
MNALQDSDTNCWNSDGGETQWYQIDFQRRVHIRQMKLQFQAGFTSEIVRIRMGGGGNRVNDDMKEIDELEPEESLELQEFDVDAEGQILRLEFEEFADFYGRITIYRLQVWGDEL